MNELGFYTLAGAPRSPRALTDEVRDAEALGLGSAFVSERWNIKEACTLSGAVGAVSTRLLGHKFVRAEGEKHDDAPEGWKKVRIFELERELAVKRRSHYA